MADGGGTDYSDVDFFSDPGVTEDPYPYYEYLRAQGPVCPVAKSGVVAVTGYDELTAVYRDSATYSAINSSSGPFPLPFTPLVKTSPSSSTPTEISSR